MTMRRVGVMQDFVRAEKREAREAKASAQASREAAMLDVQRADLHRDVATAWFEKYYADRACLLLGALEGEARLQASTTQAELSAGKAGAADALAARILIVALADRRADSDRKSLRAAAMLARWVGSDASQSTGAAPDIYTLPHHLIATESDLSSHPHIAMYRPIEAAAEADLKLAAAATKPDWSLELSYAQRGAAYSNMVSLMVRMDLPLFASQRQDPVTLSKARQLEQVRAEADDALLKHSSEVRVAAADWQAAKARVERHRNEIIPLVEERARLARAAYEGGKADLPSVLDARRGVIEARLAALDAEGELARAWAQLAYLIPDRREP
jgi:outer membrane protein TolC